MGEHALFPPSAAHRWMHCFGAVQAEAPFADLDDDSEHSLLGTFAHEQAAFALLSGNADARALLGRTDGKHCVDEEMAGNLQVYLDAVFSLQLVTSGKLYVEQRVTMVEESWGTADALIYDPTEHVLHVFDLKYGAGVFVGAEANPQLLVYASAAVKALLEIGAQVLGVELHIVQPRCPDASGETHRQASVSREELDAFTVAAVEAVARGQLPGAPRTPGEHCRWCKAAKHGACDALQQHAMTLASTVFPAFDGEGLPPELPPEALRPENVARILRAADTIEQWLKLVRERAFELAQTHELPGYKLVEVQGHRSWTDEAAAEAALRALGLNDPHTRKLLTPAAAEKQLGKRAAKDLITRMTKRPVSRKLVPESDSRPAVNPPAEQVFSALPSDEGSV